MMSFFKKEWDSYFLTNRWLILFSIFIALGILNPLSAKITPALLGNLLGEEYGILIQEPTAVDSWLQFFKNVPQIGLIAFLLMMANSMSKELQEGTLLIFLSKGLKRKSVIIAKLLFHTLMWTLGYIVSIGITYVYTIYYWDQSVVQQLLPALTGIYVFALMLIFVAFLGNTLTNSTMGGLLLTGLLFMSLVFWNTFHKTTWNPLTLFDQIEERLSQDVSFSYGDPIIVAVTIMILCVGGGILHFNKRTL